MDEYPLLTSEKERSCDKDLENSTGSTSQSWEELSLISDDDEFSLVSSDVEELSPSELMDEKEQTKQKDGPSCSFVSDNSTCDESLNDYEEHPSQTDLRAKRQRTDVVQFESDETSSSTDSSISSHTRGPGPSDKGIKESRKKDKGM